MPEDEHPVEQYVEEVHNGGDDQCRRSVAQSFEELLLQAEEEEGDDGSDTQYVVRFGGSDHLRFLPKRAEERNATTKQHDHEGRKQDGEDYTVLQQRGYFLRAVARSAMAFACFAISFTLRAVSAAERA